MMEERVTERTQDVEGLAKRLERYANFGTEHPPRVGWPSMLSPTLDEAAATIRALRSERDELREEVYSADAKAAMQEMIANRAEAALSRRDAALRELLALIDSHGWMEKVNGDWSCAECKPDSDMLVEGFQCAYHRARTEEEG